MITCFSILEINKASLTNSFWPVNTSNNLPLEAKLCFLNQQCLSLEVADTPAKKELGLMKRTFLPKGTGMLFPFSSKRIVRFWMYKTLIALDMIFYLDGVVIALERNAPPCIDKKCPFYGPDYPIDGVIELTSGEIERLEIKVGDQIRIEYQY